MDLHFVLAFTWLWCCFYQAYATFCGTLFGSALLAVVYAGFGSGSLRVAFCISCNMSRFMFALACVAATVLACFIAFPFSLFH